MSKKFKNFLSEQSIKLLAKLALSYEDLVKRKGFAIPVGRFKITTGLIPLFVVGLLKHIENKDKVLYTDIAEVMKIFNDIRKENGKPPILNYKQSLYNRINSLYRNKFITRKLIEVDGQKRYAYDLSSSGLSVFNRLLKELSGQEVSLQKAFTDEKEKEVIKELAEEGIVDEKDLYKIYVWDEMSYFKSKISWEAFVNDAWNVYFLDLNKKLPKILTRLGVESLLDFFLTEDYILKKESGVPFKLKTWGVVYRKSLILRLDKHAARTGSLYRLRKLENPNYASWDVIKEARHGINDALQFLYAFGGEIDLEDPIINWLRGTSVAISVYNEAMRQAFKKVKEYLEAVENDDVKKISEVQNASWWDYVMLFFENHIEWYKSRGGRIPEVKYAFWIIPKESAAYDAYLNTSTARRNKLDKTFLLEGIPISIQTNQRLHLGNMYKCASGKHVVIVPKHRDTGMNRCPFCGEPMTNVEEYVVDGVIAEMAVKDSEEIYLVFIPYDLFYFIKDYQGSMSNFMELMVIQLPKELQPNKKSNLLLAIGYVPTLKTEHIPDELKKEVNELSKKPTWYILNKFIEMYDEIKFNEHAVVAALLTAFSQTKKRIMPSLTEYIEAEEREYGRPPAPLATLFIGKPGTGKTSIALTTLLNANPRLGVLAYVNMKRASTAGVTATTAVSAQRRKIYLGIERAAHGTMIVYDEIDKTSDQTLLQSIADTLSEGFFTYDKAYASMLREPAISAKIFIANDHKEDYEYEDFLELFEYLANISEDKKVDRTFKGYILNFLDRIDLIVYFPKKEDLFKALSEYEKIKQKKSIDELKKARELFTAYVKMVRTFVEKIKMKKVPGIYSVIKEYVNSIREVAPEIYDFLVRYSSRRLITLLKIARTIAAIHFRDIVTEQDIREALAFYLFVTLYPWSDKYMDLFEMFKDDLGVFYEYAKKRGEITELLLAELKAIEEKRTKYIIRTKADLMLLIKRKLLSRKGKEFKVSEIIEEIIEEVKSGKVVLNPNKAWKLYGASDILNALRSEIRAMIDELYVQGYILKTSSDTYQVNEKLLEYYGSL